MRNYSLYVKFNALIVGTIFICGLLIGSLLLYTTSSEMERELDKSGVEIGQTMSAVISSDILLDDRFSMTERLMQIQSLNDQIRYIIVFHPNGQILASTFTNGIPKGLPLVREPKPGVAVDTVTFDSNEGYIREVLCPIDNGLVGYFRIGLSEKTMMQVMQHRFLEMIILIILICLASSWLATRYARSFLKPIQQMAAAVRQLGRGNYQVKVPEKTPDDVGRLARAFNTLSSRLSAREQENSRLLQALQEKEKMRMWLISQLFSAREDERRRISRELHDETSQSMVTMLAYLRIIMDKTSDADAKELLCGVRDLMKDTLEGLRHLAVNLHPPLLDDLGLIVAMEKYLDTFRRAQPHIHISFSQSGDFSHLSHPISLLCYRLMQEALTNIVRHSQADAVDITIKTDDETLTLSITDNGVGFSEDTLEQARLDNHLGIVSMRERAELLNGHFYIDSYPNDGTCIVITLPLKDSSDEGGVSHDQTD